MSGSKTVGQFIVSDTKNGIIVSTKAGDWQVKYSQSSSYGAALKNHIENADTNMLQMVLQIIYIASNACITDASLGSKVIDHMKSNLNQETRHLDADGDAKDMEIVKQNQKLKDGEKEGEKTKTGHKD